MLLKTTRSNALCCLPTTDSAPIAKIKGTSSSSGKTADVVKGEGKEAVKEIAAEPDRIA